MAKKEEEKLLGSSILGVQDNTARQLANYQAGYKEGEKVQNAYNEYNTLKQNAPQAYVSPYQQQLDDIYNKIVNRQPFKYDMRGDMLYQNAKEQYQQLGKQAMVDTMGQAAQLTGGYGNSYAQNVGNQAYQQYLLKLNDLIPEYAKLAQDRYNMEGDALNAQYGLARDRENDAYNKYRDTVSDYNQNLQLAYNVYGNERDNDYGQYRDALNYWQNQAGAENDDYWRQTQFDYQKQQDALAQSNWERELALQYAKLNKGSGSGNKTTTSNDLAGALAGALKGGISNATSAVGDAIKNLFTGGSRTTSTSGGPFLQFSNLTGNTSADYNTITKAMDNLYAKKAQDKDYLDSALVDDLKWYFDNGYITFETVEKIAKKYGLD